MIDRDMERLQKVWDQENIPVLYRQGPGRPLLLRLPFSSTNRSWIKGDARLNPQWSKARQRWELPQAWFTRLLEQCLSKFGRVFVIQPYREQEKCAPACWNAEGDECQCSCMGVNHGSQAGGRGWTVVSDAFATRWGEQHIACRLITKG